MQIKREVCICGWQSNPYPEDTLFAGLGGQLFCPKCTELQRNRNIEVYGDVKVITEEFGKDEASLLLYLETCLVDQYGRVEVRRMNAEELEIIKHWREEKFIWFGRLKMKAIEGLRGGPHGKIYTHWVRFSDEAWKIAGKLRRERSHRMLESQKRKLVREMIHV